MDMPVNLTCGHDAMVATWIGTGKVCKQVLGIEAFVGKVVEIDGQPMTEKQ